MSKPPTARYRYTNWPDDNADLCKRGTFLIWLNEGYDLVRGAGGSSPESFR